MVEKQTEQINGPASRLLWRWSDQVVFDADAGTIECSETGESFRIEPSVLERIQPLTNGLSGGGLDDRQIRSLASCPDAALLYAYLGRFLESLYIEWALFTGQTKLAVFASLVRGFRPDTAGDIPYKRVSPFAFLRFNEGRPVLQSPRAQCRAEFSEAGAHAFLDAQSETRRTQDLLSNELADTLARFGFMEDSKVGADQALESWEFSDALLHASSTRGRDLPIVGLNKGLQERFPRPPTYAPLFGPKVELPDPRHAEMARYSVLDTMRKRVSCRDWSTHDLPLENISTFLSVLAGQKTDESDAPSSNASTLPMAGGIDALGWFVVAGRIEGLDVGLYRYAAKIHRLEVFEHSRSQAKDMLKAATASMNRLQPEPQALILQTLRLPLLSWRYAGMAYRLGLLDAGVSVHAMYMVATQMGLGGCALGTVDPRPFEAATAVDWSVETPISAFALGLPA